MSNAKQIAFGFADPSVEKADKLRAVALYHHKLAQGFRAGREHDRHALMAEVYENMANDIATGLLDGVL